MIPKDTAFLIMDDSEVVRMVLKNYLRQHGCTVVREVVGAKEARALLQAQPADCLLANKAGGATELFRELRKDARFNSTAFVLTSSDVDVEEIARREGVRAFKKGSSLKNLLDAIEGALADVRKA